MPSNTNEIKSLTVKRAAALAKCKGEMRLDGLTEITPEVAEILRSNKEIHFTGR